MMRATSSASCCRPRRRHRGVADVEVEVEVRVVDPERVVEVERHVAQPPAQRLEEVEPALDLASPRRERLVVGIVGGRS